MPERQRVLVCGSRNFASQQAVIDYVNTLPEDTILVVGGARGPDTWAKDAAFERGLGCEVFLPDWDQEGVSAGYKRNVRMVEADVDLVVVFYDGMSGGSRHTVREARKRNIQTIVFRQPEEGTLC